MDNVNNDTQNMAMEWEDEIQNDGQEYIVLPEGDYTFIVKEFTRDRYPGSEKIQPCNKAVLTLAISTPDGIAIAKTDLILYRSLEWKLSSFFRCIGQKKHGERLVMDWSKVRGAEGKAHIRPREYTDKWNNTKTVNEVVSFIDPETSGEAGNSGIPF